MQIRDFMICSGSLGKYNYVLVDDNIVNINKLKSMGCSNEEIEQMRNENDNFLDVYFILLEKGYAFSPINGFFYVE